MMTTSTTERFLAHYSERLRYNWVGRNFDTGLGPIFFGPCPTPSDLEFFSHFVNLPVLLLYGNSHYLGRITSY